MKKTRENRRRHWTASRTYAKKGVRVAFGATIASLVRLGWEHVRREHGW
ncbi:hypothetical protein [Streptomyces coffeae]|uniref:Transposase n=1 Tax=Streptomyces coffeae TaxID=621382 RepID=A0ABS1NL98_9ACTN|nr:hypothetical protein [Streptomyces coffeae]MBL1100740.1 hypothetical protein [Streptomyces coffeae]